MSPSDYERTEQGNDPSCPTLPQVRERGMRKDYARGILLEMWMVFQYLEDEIEAKAADGVDIEGSEEGERALQARSEIRTAILMLERHPDFRDLDFGANKRPEGLGVP
jgi:hypothetical protein